MILDDLPAGPPSRDRIRAMLSADEAACAQALIAEARQPPEAARRIEEHAARLVEGVRRHRPPLGDLDTFLGEYRLSTQEGVVLMCLAEALLRIPDAGTADRLIRDKIGAADWAAHLGRSEWAFVNASTWALMLTGRLIRFDREGGLAGTARRLAAKAGEPVVREALVQAMRIMGRQFVMGRTIGEALARSRDFPDYRHSYDMLGEAARTADDARDYFHAYADAIAAVGTAAAGKGPVEGPGISVKLSALHPRFDYAHRDRVLRELVPRLLELCRLAQAADIGLTVDAEESDRLELSLDVIERVWADPGLAGWDGFGLAVQAYQKRARAVVAWAAELARGRRLMVRLVKGAYWDTEIKRAQERGLAGYPVFTRKLGTDVSYLACARALLAESALYPQFATHNAHTIAAVAEMAGGRTDWEYQRLHGMGGALYAQVVSGIFDAKALVPRPCRTYAPVGSHEDLLPYLVRRLLENGANTSFVNRLADATVPVARIVADPVEALAGMGEKPDPRIIPPTQLYGPGRRNSRGWDLADPLTLAQLKASLEVSTGWFTAAPLVDGNEIVGWAPAAVRDPADQRRVVGEVASASAEDIAAAVNHAVDAQPAWDALGGAARAAVLERAADLYEAAAPELMALAIREAGKTVPDAVGELREAVDFLRYYAAEARAKFGGPVALPGPTGETNHLSLHGRGVFACISPWNFPLAIFTGQVAAALAAGNAVAAKPAEQTPLIAARAVRLLLEAGVPPGVLHLLPGDGAVGAALVGHPRIGGVAFTGSTAVAQAINRTLAAKEGPIVPLIAETGGLNAMIVDSSALAEQVVGDVLASAFQSAGQRCSALRILFLQDEIYGKVTDMLAGAALELAVGDPGDLATDVGPVIDRDALRMLETHAATMARDGRLLFQGALPPSCEHGLFFAPRAFVLDRPELLEREVFGPILHIVRYDADRLETVLDWLERAGYGLTLGIHSRIDAVAGRIRARARIGNLYVNRSMIGAVVGTQPFGGEGLSGTGPKAGGPHYLLRFAAERTVSVNIAAAGGNPALLAME